MEKNNKINVAFASLGCDKNRVDTEMMIAAVSEAGYNIVSRSKDAHAIIINTCAFIESARKESIDTVLSLANSPQRPKILVCGCLPQLYKEGLLNYLTEADCIVGIDQKNIVEHLQYALQGKQRQAFGMCQSELWDNNRVLTTPKHYAFLKIADGCNNFCSYCTIPYIRGRYRSLPIETLVAQAQALAKQGVCELIFVAQDVTRYGVDIYGHKALCRLIEQISKIEQIKLIRLLYCYPELIDEQLLECIYGNEKVANYLDIPLQHVDDRILKAMNRRSTSQSLQTLFDTLTTKFKDIVIRSTFICGFPTERDSESKQIDAFLKKYKLCNVGFFAYSKESGTTAATMEKQVRQSTKLNRYNRLYKIQQTISKQVLASFVGKEIACIIDGRGLNGFVGRTYFQAPDIDGVCYITTSKQLSAGDICKVKITNSTEYDLFGEVL